jgi:hypothetical protein
MTKISNQYSLTNVLTADVVNGRVGIGTEVPNTQLQVNGTPSNDWGNTTLFDTRTQAANQGGMIAFAGYKTGTTAQAIFAQIKGNKENSTAGNEAGYLSFLTNNNTTYVERMRITSAGNVGIGTTSPNLTATNRTTVDINGTTESLLAFSNGGTSRGYIYHTATDNIIWAEGARNMQFGIAGAGFMGFGTNNTERMRITSGGNVMIGTTTSNSYKFTVNGIVAALGSECSLLFQNRTSTNTYEWYATSGTIFVYSSSSASNILSINGSNGAYTALSDVNKKKDFEQSSIGLNEVLQLKPTLYRMKTDDESSSKELGFIAQEVNEFIPQAYVETGEGDKKFIGLNQMPIIAALTKAIQELSADLTSAKQEIELLKAK